MKCEKCGNYNSNDLNECFFCKVKKNKRICIIILILLILFLSPFGIPEFIRAIPGVEFIPLWFAYFIFISILSGISIFVFSLRFLKKNGYAAINNASSYTINDLLFINEIKNFKYVAYCILKLKLDKIIKYNVISSEKGDAQTSNIKIFDNITISELEEYRKNNCFLEPVIELLITNQNSTEPKNLSMNDVFENFTSSADSYKKIMFPNYIVENCTNYAEYSQKYKTILASINTITFWTIFSVAFSKFIMGISFGKPVSNLFIAIFFGLFYFLGFFSICYTSAEHRLNKKWIKKINEACTLQYTREQFDTLLSNNEDYNDEEKNNLLKTFITADKKYLSNSNTDLTFATSLINTMVAVEAAYNSSSSGGCSGCGGGCGGCGGGCGGCGD